MDCPSEENLIRMKLDEIERISDLSFDLEKRDLIVFHNSDDQHILQALQSLNLGASLINSEIIFPGKGIHSPEKSSRTGVQKKILRWVLGINIGFFVLEILAGFFSGSMGLVADSLDMLADAMVYGLSLWAVGASIKRKKLVASLAGYIQIILAVGGFSEVIRRMVLDSEIPDFRVMIIVSCFALIANALCLYLLQKTRSNEIHMKASMIFTSNDIIINAGVIIAGLLVLFSGSNYPDLIVGSIIFIIVLRGAFRILKLGKG
jgi:Co/Zn/Cd efflux system component